MAASSSSSSEFTADELEAAAEALIKLKTTDPDSNLSDFFPRWLQKKKRLLPYDEKSSERGKRVSPDTPLDLPRSPISGDKNPSSRLPPLLSCSKMGSLKKNGDEKQSELVNEKEKEMMNAASATHRNFQECVMEAANRYPILEDDNSSLRQIQSSQYNQTLARQQYQPQSLELFSMGPTHPVDQLPDLNLTPPAEVAAMTMAPAAAAEAPLPDLNLTPPGEESATKGDVELIGRRLRAAECAQARKRRLEMMRSKSSRLKRKVLYV